ncbi:Plasmodium vivax Vir protein, putative [Plasmodium vivax]|uniref:Vir protein, putative n=1 Tax=Plasmodium vivax TaxID=5855 RepID=A0A1G4EDR2_PLAVI|nr:Plasmodium vivax Vir protein, putative [Plasmodium vivax]
MSDILGNEKLGFMRTKRNYQNFDEEKGTCNDFSFYSEARKKLISYDGLLSVSDKILKAVCYVHNKSKSSDFDVDTCKFLYFWLGNMLFSNLKDTNFVSEVIIELYHRLNENGFRKFCEIPYIRMEESDFKKTKLIFDYFEDYWNYKLDLGTHIRSCNKDYYTFLKTYVDTYKQLYNECINEHQKHKYCEAFHDFYDVKKHEYLYSWSCNLKESSSEPHALPGNTEDSENQEKLYERPRGEALEAKVQQKTVMISPTHVKNQETSGPSLHDITSEIAITSEDTTPSITSKSITGAVSVAGALVPSYLLYNYTPAGNLINKLLGRTTRMNHNPLMEAQLMNNFYQPEGFNSERSGYNISYRPV